MKRLPERIHLVSRVEIGAAAAADESNLRWGVSNPPLSYLIHDFFIIVKLLINYDGFCYVRAFFTAAREVLVERDGSFSSTMIAMTFLHCWAFESNLEDNGVVIYFIYRLVSYDTNRFERQRSESGGFGSVNGIFGLKFVALVVSESFV